MNNDKYKCKTCGKQFISTHTINRHLNKKIPCDSEAKQQYKDNKRTCRYCGKLLCNYHILRNHETICKKKDMIHENEIFSDDNNDDSIQEENNKPDNIISIQNNIEELKKKMELQIREKIREELKEEIKEELLEELRKEMKPIKQNKRKKKINLNSNNKNTNINSHNNNNNNINSHNNNNYIKNINHINITAYGQETCDHISDNMFKKIIDKGFKSVPYLVEQMHFNKDKPEYHNVYISNMRDNYVLIFDGVKWVLTQRDELLDDMMDAKSYILSDKFDKLKDDLKDYTKVKFQRFLDESDSDKVKEQIKNDIKLSLYNNKSLPETTKQQSITEP